MGRYFVRDFGREVAPTLGIDTSAPDWEAKWTEALGQEQAFLGLLGDDRFWYYALGIGLRTEPTTKDVPDRLVAKLNNPLALPMLLCDLLILVAARQVWRLLGQAEEEFPGEQIPATFWETRLEQHPLDVHFTALSFEEHARRYAAHHPRLEGPQGALLLLHAAYAGAITGLECRDIWPQLLDSRDTTDPAMNLSHALYELAHRRNVVAQIHTLQNFLTTPPAELRETLAAVGFTSEQTTPKTATPTSTPPTAATALPVDTASPKPRRSRPTRKPPRRSPRPK
jgi:hypothetical protein